MKHLVPDFPKLPPFPNRYDTDNLQSQLNDFLDALPEFVEKLNELISKLNEVDE